MPPPDAEAVAYSSPPPESSQRPAGAGRGPIDMRLPHGERADAFDEAGAGGEFIADDAGGELASIHAYYATLIAGARGSLRPGDAAAMVRRLRAEKGAAIRAVRSRLAASRAARARRPVRNASRTPNSHRHVRNG